MSHHSSLVIILFCFFFPTHSNAGDVKTSNVRYASGQDTVTAFFAEPDGPGPYPAIILIHEWWGLTDWIRDNARLFASKGYVAIAIDLYRGNVASDAEEAHQLMRGLPQDRAVRDLKAAMNYLKLRKNVKVNKIGSIGWCMGGTYSLQAALSLPDLAACVINYGGLVEDDSLIQKIEAPILVNAGADDRWPSPDDVKKFDERMTKAGKKIRSVFYNGAAHAFMNSTNVKAYRKDRAEEAWHEIFSFFESNLMK